MISEKKVDFISAECSLQRKRCSVSIRLYSIYSCMKVKAE